MKEKYYSLASNYQLIPKTSKISFDHKKVGAVTIWYHTTLVTQNQSIVVYHQLWDEPDLYRDEIGLLNQRRHFFRFIKADDKEKNEITEEIQQIYEIYSAYYSLKLGYAIGCDNDELSQHMLNISKQFGIPLSLHFDPVSADIDVIEEEKNGEFVLSPIQIDTKKAMNLLIDNQDQFENDNNLPVKVFNTKIIPVEW
jgi:hypothetical protein